MKTGSLSLLPHSLIPCPSPSPRSSLLFSLLLSCSLFLHLLPPFLPLTPLSVFSSPSLHPCLPLPLFPPLSPARCPLLPSPVFPLLLPAPPLLSPLSGSAKPTRGISLHVRFLQATLPWHTCECTQTPAWLGRSVSTRDAFLPARKREQREPIKYAGKFKTVAEMPAKESPEEKKPHGTGHQREKPQGR